jgi:hypothetical protein
MYNVTTTTLSVKRASGTSAYLLVRATSLRSSPRPCGSCCSCVPCLHSVIARSDQYRLGYLPANRVTELAELFNSASIWSEYSNSSSVIEEKLSSIYDQCGFVNDELGTFVFVFNHQDEMVAYFTFTRSEAATERGFSGASFLCPKGAETLRGDSLSDGDLQPDVVIRRTIAWNPGSVISSNVDLPYVAVLRCGYAHAVTGRVDCCVAEQPGPGILP